MEFNHYSVLKQEAVEGLNVKSGKKYVDGTAGGGGHSYEIAEKLKGTGKLILIDRDAHAIKVCQDRLKNFKNIDYRQDNFFNIKNVLTENKVDGILLDLGVSSYQIDAAERGFSYKNDTALLDMRMDQTQVLTAEQVINEYSEHALYEMIKNYGEEQFAKNIAKHIVQDRQNKKITTAGDLKVIINKSIPAKIRFGAGGSPYKRTFQAIRIAVNGELEGLKKAIEDCFDSLTVGGRLAVITFHSLEDRTVKEAFSAYVKGCECKEYAPVCICGKKEKGKLINRKPILPSQDELQKNSRSKSAKLRIIEKL